ncbi:MAG: Uma2 family endonuclease [Planctomycetaceae bacterium]|nr:Uma2 family endonuclease [Planctomycetaceae bacterium]
MKMSTAAKSKAPTQSRFVAERRLVIQGASWDDYLALSGSLHERTVLRVAFDGKDIEIMTKGRDHDRFSYLIDKFIVAVAHAQGVLVEPFGETTWTKPGIERGIEADQWYFFDAAKRECIAKILRDERARGIRSNSLEGFPSPDLAVEIDISPPKVDRPGIYAALGVAELWRFDGEVAVIERLSPEGRYEPLKKSQWLEITPADVVRWVAREDATEFIPWLDRVTKWARRKSAGKRS